MANCSDKCEGRVCCSTHGEVERYNMSEIKLKPCPFCYEPFVVDDEIEKTVCLRGVHELGECYVFCERCEAKGPPNRYLRRCAEAAAEAWNTRGESQKDFNHGMGEAKDWPVCDKEFMPTKDGPDMGKLCRCDECKCKSKSPDVRYPDNYFGWDE